MLTLISKQIMHDRHIATDMIHKHSCSPENGVRHPESLGMILTSAIADLLNQICKNHDSNHLTNWSGKENFSHCKISSVQPVRDFHHPSKFCFSSGPRRFLHQNFI